MSSSSLNLSPEALRAESAALLALARALLGNEHDAQDVEQDTWLAALQHRSTNSDRAAPWLRRVGYNFALRLRRKERARRSWEHAAARPESLPSTVEIVERVELHQRVVEAVLALDEP